MLRLDGAISCTALTTIHENGSTPILLMAMQQRLGSLGLGRHSRDLCGGRSKNSGTISLL